MTDRDFPPIHPGEILHAEFLKPMGISQDRLADDIGVPLRLVREVIQGAAPISADTALRLGRYFSIEPQFWLNLQSRYDLIVAEQSLSARLAHEVRPRAA